MGHLTLAPEGSPKKSCPGQRQPRKSPHLEFLGFPADLEQLGDGIHEALVVEVAHLLDLPVVVADPRLQLLHEAPVLLPIVHGPAGTQRCSALPALPLPGLTGNIRNPTPKTPSWDEGMHHKPGTQSGFKNVSVPSFFSLSHHFGVPSETRTG